MFILIAFQSHKVIDILETIAMIKKKKIVTLIFCCTEQIFGRRISEAILGRNVKQIRCRGLKIVYKIGIDHILSNIWNSLRITRSVLNIECNDSKCLRIPPSKEDNHCNLALVTSQVSVTSLGMSGLPLKNQQLGMCKLLYLIINPQLILTISTLL